MRFSLSLYAEYPGSQRQHPRFLLTGLRSVVRRNADFHDPAGIRHLELIVLGHLVADPGQGRALFYVVSKDIILIKKFLKCGLFLLSLVSQTENLRLLINVEYGKDRA